MNIRSAFPALIALGIFFCLTARATAADSGATFSFPLKYSETGFTQFINFQDGGKQEFKFRKEPKFGKDRILRHALKVGPKREDYMGFAVNLTSRTLYIDLNRNLDLTDDLRGVVKGTGNSNNAIFINLRLNLSKDGVDRQYLMDLFCYGQSPSYMMIKSTYRGDIELYGQKWQVELRDNLDGVIDRQDQISISPQDSEKPLGFRSMQPADRIFMGGRLYQVAYRFGAGSVLTADFRETGCTLGQLALEGQHIQRMILEGTALAILDSPGTQIPLPAGSYRIRDVLLQTNPYRGNLTGNLSKLPEIRIAAGTPYHMKLGGPLQNTVAVEAHGSFLQLDYRLAGAGGESYSVNAPDRNKPPRFAIHKGDRLVAAGNFQFG